MITGCIPNVDGHHPELFHSSRSLKGVQVMIRAFNERVIECYDPFFKCADDDLLLFQSDT